MFGKEAHKEPLKERIGWECVNAESFLSDMMDGAGKNVIFLFDRLDSRLYNYLI